MLKKLTAILMSLMLVLSVTAVFAAEAPTLVQTSETLSNADVITLAGYTDTTDAENPVVNYKAYRNRSIITATTTSAQYSYDVFRDGKTIDDYGKGWDGKSYYSASGIPYDYVKAYFRMNIADAKTADKVELKLNFAFQDTKVLDQEIYVSPVDSSQAAALYSAATDKTATLVNADVVPAKQSAMWTTGAMNSTDVESPVVVDVTDYVTPAIEAGEDYVTFEVNVRSGSDASTYRKSLRIYTKGDKQAQLVFTNSVVSFEKRVQDSYKLQTSEFALTDSANPDTVVDAKSAKVYFASKEMFVKADLSAYSEEELSEAQLGFTNWGGSYKMEVYKLDDYVWDASTLTYNIAKEKIEELKAGTPDLSLTVNNSAWRYPIADLVDEEGQLNIMIVNHDTNANKTLYGSESQYGPKIVFTPYYTTAEAIVNNTAMKIKASAASYEAGTAAVPFVALYDAEGALSEVIMGSVITSGGEVQSTEIAITAAQATAASTIKVFMWADGTLVPLNDVVSQINK